MDREEYLQNTVLKFIAILKIDLANNIITKEIFDYYMIELEATTPIEYKHGLYMSYLMMRRG